MSLLGWTTIKKARLFFPVCAPSYIMLVTSHYRAHPGALIKNQLVDSYIVYTTWIYIFIITPLETWSKIWRLKGITFHHKTCSVCFFVLSSIDFLWTLVCLIENGWPSKTKTGPDHVHFTRFTSCSSSESTRWVFVF